MTRIRWAKDTTDHPGYENIPEWTGTAGSRDIYLFLICKRSLDGDRYVLSTQLPGMDSYRRSSDDPEELKQVAEDWLARFVSSLGAIFPEAHTSRSDNVTADSLTAALEEMRHCAEGELAQPGASCTARDSLILLAAVEAVLELHHPVYTDYIDGDGIERASRDCAECEPPGTPDNWPCATVRAITRELGAQSEASTEEKPCP